MSDLVLHHHIQRCLQRDLGLPLHEADDDGDYVAYVEGHPVWVRPLLDDGPVALVRVWSPVIHQIKPTLAVLREVNELNLGLRLIRLVVAGKTILASVELELMSVEPGELGRIIRHVGNTAVHVGELITAVHGGALPERALFDVDLGLEERS